MFAVRTLFTAILSILMAVVIQAGDRNPGYRIEYPADALIQNGGCVYDVTRPPVTHLPAAIGDGVTDDLPALRAALDYVLAQMDAGRSFEDPETGRKPAHGYIIYLPDRIYRISGSLTYSGRTRFKKGAGRNENVVGITLVGQSREKTVLRLDRDCPGFADPAKPNAAVVFARPDCNFNNWNTRAHGCRNLTVDVTNNRGANGIDFWSANSSLMMNLKVTADPGCGKYGLHLRIAVQAGYYQDVTVESFEIGIMSEGQPRASQPVFEHVTLTGQRKAGISIAHASTTLRDLETHAAGSALVLAGDEAQVILLDSLLNGTGNNLPAIDSEGKGHLFARNVKINGYNSCIRQEGDDIFSGDIEEFSSYPWRKTREGAETLKLPVKNVPVFAYPSVSEWIKPAGEDTVAVQAALNASKAVVCFPSTAGYSFKTVKVPSGVKRIEGLGQETKGTLLIQEDSPDPLIVMDARGVNIVNHSKRTVVVYNTNWGSVGNDGTEQEWFLCNIDQTKISGLSNAKVWGRWINAEGSVYFKVNNCTWAQLGYKSERQKEPGVQIENSGVELLGGTFGVENHGTLATISADSRAVILASNSGPYKTTEPVVIDKGGKSLKKEDFPVRSSKPPYWFYMIIAN